MSTQIGILSKFSSKKLWTVPSKEQYLPSYFKRLCDKYVDSPSPRRVFPVECIGLQRKSDPPTWVISSNIHVSLENGVAKRLSETESPFAVLGDEIDPLPFLHIPEDNGLLDGGEALREIVEMEAGLMGRNFPPALLILGGMGVGFHYEEIRAMFDGVPLVMAYGLPVSGKSLAVEVAMSLIGESRRIGECTQAGVLKKSGARTLPFWWDDVSDFGVLEALTVHTFNQAQRNTATATQEGSRTIPIMTMNPQCLRKKKLDKEKISRVFSRIAIIPFNPISEVQTLESCLDLKAKLHPLLEKAVLSIGTMVELRSAFEGMREDDIFKDICSLMNNSQLDMRSQLNYALILFATGKILEKISLFCHFDQVKEYFVNCVTPNHLEILDGPGGDTMQPEVDMMSVVNSIVEKCSTQPEETKGFFIRKTVMSKCLCGDCFGFRAKDALEFAGITSVTEQQLKQFVRNAKKGCCGRLTFQGRGQISGCIHIQRNALSKDLLATLDAAFTSKSSALQSTKTIAASNLLQTRRSTPAFEQEADESVVLAQSKNKEADLNRRSTAKDMASGVLAQSKNKEADLSRRSTAKDMASDEDVAKLNVNKLKDNPEKAKSKKREVLCLEDGLHPGEVSGKRKRTKKFQ